MIATGGALVLAAASLAQIRRKQLKAGNIGSDRHRTRWATIPRRPLLRLEQIGDGLRFEPDEQ